MANVFDYLQWRGDIPLRTKPMNEVDGMILSRFAYAPFELVGGAEAVTIGKACRDLLAIPGIEKKLLMKEDKKLLELLSESERFSELVLIEYVNRVDETDETQFSAITVQIGRGKYYVAFRGTDESLIGWKEDFNMSFTTPVPAQTLAVEYFERVASRVMGTFSLGGHSKGGNLAVYAAAFCNPRYRTRIRNVENFDGPGFGAEVLRTDGYMQMQDMVSTFIPQSSVVGLLLEHEENFTIVKSTSQGLFQHDTYSWEIERDKYVYLETVTGASRFLDHAMKEWLAGMTPEKREKLVDTLFDTLSETNAKTVKDLGENWVGNSISILRSLRTLDDESRKLLTEAVHNFVRGAGKVLSELRPGK